MRISRVEGRNHFYVYLLLNPSGDVIYVGKGCGLRVISHYRDALSGRDVNNRKLRTIRNIWAQGGVVRWSIVFETWDELEALRVEKACIQFYDGPKLTNVMRPINPRVIRRSKRVKVVSTHVVSLTVKVEDVAMVTGIPYKELWKMCKERRIVGVIQVGGSWRLPRRYLKEPLEMVS